MGDGKQAPQRKSTVHIDVSGAIEGSCDTHTLPVRILAAHLAEDPTDYAHDESRLVREVVASRGFAQPLLINDPEDRVVQAVRSTGYGKNITQ